MRFPLQQHIRGPGGPPTCSRMDALRLWGPSLPSAARNLLIRGPTRGSLTCLLHRGGPPLKGPPGVSLGGPPGGPTRKGAPRGSGPLWGLSDVAQNPGGPVNNVKGPLFISSRFLSLRGRRDTELLQLLQQQQQEAARQLSSGALWHIWNPPGIVFSSRR